MTVNWGMGFFLGLKFVFILIVLAMEFYFLVFDRYTEGEIDRTEFAVLCAVTAICIIIPAVQLKNFSVGFWLIFPVPLCYAIFRFLEYHHAESVHEKFIEKKIKNLEDKIARNPRSPNSYHMLGDIYFKKGDYGRALINYREAYGIRETTELQQKIKITAKEDRIQKGEVWVCRECGTDNSGESERCTNCGSARRPVASIKEDILKNKAEIKKWVILGFGIPLVIISVVVLMKSFLPSGFYDFLAIAAGLLVIYLMLRKFFTW